MRAHKDAVHACMDAFGFTPGPGADDDVLMLSLRCRKRKHGFSSRSKGIASGFDDAANSEIEL